MNFKKINAHIGIMHLLLRHILKVSRGFKFVRPLRRVLRRSTLRKSCQRRKTQMQSKVFKYTGHHVAFKKNLTYKLFLVK